MSRRVRLSLAGVLLLLAVAGCGRSFFAEREPWRREAEVQCLKSGAVRETPAIAMQTAISGPGACGADFPLRVAALGESPALSFTDERLRPPGTIPRGHPLAGPRAPIATRPAPETFSQSVNDPIELRPPSVERWRDSTPETHAAPANLSRPPYEPRNDRWPEHRRPTFDSAPGPSPLPPQLQAGALSSPARIPAAVAPAATLACPMVSALDGWVSDAVQPAALKWFGQPVTEIKQISAYSCRGMNGNRHAKISEHAFGNALDIAAFALADGRKVTVREGWRGSPAEQGFLRDVHASACERFSTVLAPGSNIFHYDHIHVDLMRRASGQTICNPDPVSGDVVAARASPRRAGLEQRRRPDFESGDGESTASVPDTAPRQRRGARSRSNLPDAIPGMD